MKTWTRQQDDGAGRATNGQSITKFDDLNMLIEDVAFGPTGNLAIAGEYKSPQGGRVRGVFSFWSLPPEILRRRSRADVNRASFKISKQFRHVSVVGAVAPGGDNTYFATDEGLKRPSGVWNTKSLPGFHMFFNVPSSSSVTKLSFASDGRS